MLWSEYTAAFVHTLFNSKYFLYLYSFVYLSGRGSRISFEKFTSMHISFEKTHYPNADLLFINCENRIFRTLTQTARKYRILVKEDNNGRFSGGSRMFLIREWSGMVGMVKNGREWSRMVGNGLPYSNFSTTFASDTGMSLLTYYPIA